MCPGLSGGGTRNANMMFWVFTFATILSVGGAEQPPKTVMVTCPAGYELLGSSCYLVTGHSFHGSAAEQVCSTSGGHAAIIESKEEMDLLKESLLKSTVHLGVNMQRFRENLFKFLLKMAGHAGFTDFHAGEPDNYGAEDCVVAEASYDFEWKDVHCTESYPVLCKTEPILSPAAPSCGYGAQLYGASTCFWANGSMAHTWSAAQEVCASKGMRLASVHTQEENDFIHGLADHEWTWIGLTDSTTEGEYVWTDGTPLDFQNWHEGEPQGGASSNCVGLWASSGGWYDGACSGSLGVACRGIPT